MKNTNQPSLAISTRQPYVEMILREIKIAEYRSCSTNIRGEVYIYAARKREIQNTIQILVGNLESFPSA